MKTYSFILEGINEYERHQTVRVTCKNIKLYDEHVSFQISPDGKLSICIDNYGFTWKKFLDCVELFDLNEKIYLRNPKTIKGKPVSIKRIYKKLIHLKIDNSFRLGIENHSIVLKKTSKSENLIDRLVKKEV